MPRVIDCFPPTELPDMLSNNLTILDHLNQAGCSSDRCRLARYFADDTVVVAIIVNQTGIGHPALLLNIPVKRRAYRYQAGLFFPVSYTHLTLPTKRIV